MRGVAILIFAFLILSFSAISQAQDLSAEAVWTFDTDKSIRTVAVGDLNGDNVPDVIASEYSSNNYGDQSWVWAIDGSTGLEIWHYLVEDGIRAMTTGDVNDDGIIDAIVGGSYNTSGTPDGQVHALDGSSGTVIWTYSVNETVTSLSIGDFNGDIYMDVAVGSFGDNVIAVNGQNGSQLWSNYLGSLWVNSVATGDVDGDMIDDVAYAHEYLAGYDNYVGVLAGSGGSDLWQLTVPYIGLSSKLADIDDDGNLEAIFGVVYDDDHGEVHVRDAATGTLEWSYNLGALDHSNGDIVLGIADLEDDGEDDLVVGTYLGDNTIILFDGDTDVPLWISDTIDGEVRDLSFGDINDDKDIDVICAASSKVEAVNGADGSYLFQYGVAGSINSVACADFDNDEIIEIVAGGGASFTGDDPVIGVWLLKSVISPLLWIKDFGEYGNALTVADMNGDGYDEVITVSSLDDYAMAIDGSSGETFWTWQGTANLYAIASGDIDGDGFGDVAVGGADDMVTAIDGETSSIIWQFTNPTDQVYRKCIKMANLNGTGGDEVIAGTDDNNVYAIDNSKGLLWSTNVGGEVTDIKVFDMDYNGVPDIVVGVGYGGNKVYVLNGADGSVLWQYTASGAVEHVSAEDFNDDGVGDAVIAVSTAPKHIEVISGADQTQLVYRAVDLATNINGIDVGDLNDDKIPEIIVPGTSTDKNVHAIDGSNSSELWSFATGGEVNCVKVYDVDLDGHNEVVAGSDDQNLYILNGLTGDMFFVYACSDDVMDIGMGDISNNGLPNLACLTFGSSGDAYAFKTFATGPQYVCGDANDDGLVNLLDITFLIDYLYNGAEPNNLNAADANGDGYVNILDITYLIAYLYAGGPDLICEG